MDAAPYQPPVEDKMNPMTGVGMTDKTPPGTGGAMSPAHPKTGRGKRP